MSSYPSMGAVSREEYFDAIAAGRAGRVRELVQREPALLREVAAPAYAPEQPLRCTGLHAAVHAGSVDVARVLVEAGIDLEAATLEGRRALHDAIEFGQSEIARLLEEAGAELDICCAAILGRLELLREWLDRDPALANDRSTGLSPLGWASFGNRTETARELIARGARMDDGELTCAGSVGHAEVARVLLEAGCDPNWACPESGTTALHAAASMRYTCDAAAFVDVVLEFGADPEAKTVSGRTPLELAEAGHRAQLAAPPPEFPKDFAAVIERLRRA